VGGAALSAGAVLLVAWALGLAISGSRIGPITAEVRSSAILGKVNDLLPRQAGNVLGAFNDVVGSSFFPRYLEPFAPETIINVGPPPGRMLHDPDVVADEAGVLKVHGQNSCGRGVEGSGFLYADDRLMTNAHVVAGVRDPEVLIGDSVEQARVVFYDPELDIAVLAFDDEGRAPLTFDLRDKDPGTGAAVLGYPEDGPYNLQAARVRAQQRLRSPDIYGNGTVIRDVYSVRGLIRPGNSGGPLVGADGRVIGVVFAASVTDADTGYALTASQVAQAAARGVSSSGEVGTQGCAS
jgi:S1-C subfamily serine protease